MAIGLTEQQVTSADDAIMTDPQDLLEDHRETFDDDVCNVDVLMESVLLLVGLIVGIMQPCDLC